MKDLCVICGADISDLGIQVCCQCSKDIEDGGAFNMGSFHSKKICIKNGKWDKGEFKCRICGGLIALAYRTEGKVHIWKMPLYKKYEIPTKNISFIYEIKEDESEKAL